MISLADLMEWCYGGLRARSRDGVREAGDGRCATSRAAPGAVERYGDSEGGTDDDDMRRFTGLGVDRLPYFRCDTYSAWLCAIRSMPEGSYSTGAGACRPWRLRFPTVQTRSGRNCDNSRNLESYNYSLYI